MKAGKGIFQEIDSGVCHAQSMFFVCLRWTIDPSERIILNGIQKERLRGGMV